MLEKMDADLKAAMLAGDKNKTEVIKGLKNALQYEAVAKAMKLEELSDEQSQAVLAKEAKKRQEAADIYKNAGETERADKELAEKTIIEQYLPEQMGEDELRLIVSEEVSKVSNPTIKDMGQIIGAVRSRAKGRADGAMIASLVKEKLDTK